MRVVDIIRKKRDGLSLNKEEIEFLIKGIAENTVPDYQISAFSMAVFFQHMDEEELYYMTKAMVENGETLDFSAIKGLSVDKHSTGGVGDKISLILTPLVASAGVRVNKMSGRALGHTGGTIDKLESIPGMNGEISKEDFIKQINEIGCGIISQTGNLAPADKRMYSIRDVTATVENTALIAASIVSKKLAAGNKNIVFDVKVGKGAFMKTEPRATDLAETMVDLVRKLGGKAIAVISQMDQPLGREVGNANEIKEVIETLKGRGPEDVTNLTLALGSRMLVLIGKYETLEEARNVLVEKLETGEALNKFKEMLKYQGGDVRVVDDYTLLPQPKNSLIIKSDKSGYVKMLDAYKVGNACNLLGAGRRKKDDVIDYSAGITFYKKIGDYVEEGDDLCQIYWSGEDILPENSVKILKKAYIITGSIAQAKPIIFNVVE